MNVTIKVIGLEAAEKQLKAQAKKVDPVLRGALNTTATKTRTERFVKPLGSTMKGARVRRALKVKRANSRRSESRIIPSSSGIPITLYSKWGYDVIDATRARLWVIGPNGKKIAAGFVNPSSAGRKPLITRTSKRGRSRTYTYQKLLQEAMAPSLAYWFKQLATNQTIKWTSDFLREEFAKRMQKELNKGPR
jgi:hypothetical protein